MATPAPAALWLLVGAAPVCFWVAWSDMARMRIPNPAVLALVAVFAVVGVLVLPLGDWLWRWAHLAVVLVVGIALNAARLVGAGDAKFAAAGAPFVALGDLRTLVLLFAAVLIAAFVTHRIAKHSPARGLAPGWASWSSGKRFPMGLALGGTLAAYLALAASAP